MSKDHQFTRKDFFKTGPLSLFRAFLQGTQEPNLLPPYSGPILRPPGALPEQDFLNLCVGTGACSTVCPAEAIQMVLREDDPERYMPVIHPAEAACVLCDDLSCMKACPTGALKLVSKEAIQIGFAVVDTEECVTWSGQDQTCRFCVDRCPVGENALWIEENGSHLGPVVGAECVGCGVCEFHCPVYPAAIRVMNRARI